MEPPLLLVAAPVISEEWGSLCWLVLKKRRFFLSYRQARVGVYVRGIWTKVRTRIVEFWYYTYFGHLHFCVVERLPQFCGFRAERHLIIFSPVEYSLVCGQSIDPPQYEVARNVYVWMILQLDMMKEMLLQSVVWCRSIKTTLIFKSSESC
jgi:hypothetical protein